jgi:hypothetical protein
MAPMLMFKFLNPFALRFAIAMSACAAFGINNSIAANDSKTCLLKNIAKDPARTDGYRNKFMFPTVLEVDQGQETVWRCVKVNGLEGISSVKSSRRALVSINSGPATDKRQSIKDGDQIEVRIKAPAVADEQYSESLVFDDDKHLATFELRVRNDDRAPKIFRVGKGREFVQLTQVVPLLRAGDTVEVDPGQYTAVEFTRSGTTKAPIMIRGSTKERPFIQGGVHTVHFKNANNIIFENFDVSGGSESCIRSMADHVIVRNVFVHDCDKHGLLGADLGSGSLTIENSEFTRVGASRKGINTKHAIYVATDRDAYPNSTLRVANCYIHQYKGGGIKSRSARTEIIGNWIEAMDHPETIYSIELYGFEEYVNDEGLTSDVVDNVLIHHKIYGIRIGGDGTGASRGRVRLANNILLFNPKLFAQNPAIRMFQALDSVYLVNNIFSWSAEHTAPIRLFRDDITEEKGWREGQAKIAGFNNIWPKGSNQEPAQPQNLKETVYTTVRFNATPELALVKSTELNPWMLASKQNATVPKGYEIERPHQSLEPKLNFKRPISGEQR